MSKKNQLDPFTTHYIADPISLALLEALTKARPDEEKGCVKSKHFCHLKATRPGLSTGESRMAVVITMIQEIIVIGKMGSCFGFLFHPSQRGGKRVVLS